MSIDPFMLKQIYQAIGQFIFGIQWNNIDSSVVMINNPQTSLSGMGISH